MIATDPSRIVSSPSASPRPPLSPRHFPSTPGETSSNPQRGARSKSTASLRTRSRSRSRPRHPPSPAITGMPISESPVEDLPDMPSSPFPTASSTASTVVPCEFKSNRIYTVEDEERSSSPDIESIISATPRPLRKQQSSPSDLGDASTTICSKSGRSSMASSSLGSRSRKSSNVDEREKDGDKGEESDDSSLDLHTPLP